MEEIIATPRSVCFAVKLADKFGDYGLVSVVLGVAGAADTLRLDTWLMSCRAMGRTLEHWVMNHVAASARAFGFTRITGEYLPTAKNAPVKSLLADFGFAQNESDAHELELDKWRGLATQVTL